MPSRASVGSQRGARPLVASARATANPLALTPDSSSPALALGGQVDFIEKFEAGLPCFHPLGAYIGISTFADALRWASRS